MAEGLLLSEDEFHQGIYELKELSDRIGDLWVLASEKSSKFLSKRVIQYLPLCPEQTDDSPRDEIAVLEKEESLETLSDLEITATETSERILCSCEYHIIFSSSYGVPVLYFNFYKQDGSLLKLNDVWSTIPDAFNDRLIEEKWTFITQQEHPIRHKPFFHLHPCHTGQLMKASSSLSTSNTPLEYIIRWMSSIAPVVHLNVPMKYAHFLPDGTPG
ncbi:hypothetical protein CAPTEDRAFT_225544 [Capitella teleta]|uniref:Ubiquitin-like-conjugating enzyme ATG10 n=1 Tax=Capitella teleta TaxID=283909 RepID=R7T4Q0_CAPTE|nr:hypothetical protein CAPTEDRAFT_225544 [Capitella teleta]|eukprot:ELT88047.1 hypothetical protein CAPTEDRAFT_225544 [Capitella teleta]